MRTYFAQHPRRVHVLLGAFLVLLLGALVYWHVTAYGYDDLAAGLRQAGATTATGRPFSPSPFHAPSRTLVVDGVDVDVYDYPLPPLGALDSLHVSPDGQLGNIDWVDVPHFYRKGRLIVQYNGTDARTLALLAAALGPPFAQG